MNGKYRFRHLCKKRVFKVLRYFLSISKRYLVFKNHPGILKHFNQAAVMSKVFKVKIRFGHLIKHCLFDNLTMYNFLGD